jgi:hypothetical protein
MVAHSPYKHGGRELETHPRPLKVICDFTRSSQTH